MTILQTIQMMWLIVFQMNVSIIIRIVAMKALLFPVTERCGSAKGKWIAFLDSDDLWIPQKLEMQIAFMKENGYLFSYTNYEEINELGEKTGVQVTGPHRITKTGMFNYCWPGCLTVMYDAEALGLIQIEDIKKNNDYAMWLKICKKANCYLLDECMAQYRKGRVGSVSTQSIKTMIKWHYKLFRDAEHEPIVISIINTCRNLVYGFYKKSDMWRKRMDNIRKSLRRLCLWRSSLG